MKTPKYTKYSGISMVLSEAKSLAQPNKSTFPKSALLNEIPSGNLFSEVPGNTVIFRGYNYVN